MKTEKDRAGTTREKKKYRPKKTKPKPVQLANKRG